MRVPTLLRVPLFLAACVIDGVVIGIAEATDNAWLDFLPGWFLGVVVFVSYKIGCSDGVW